MISEVFDTEFLYNAIYKKRWKECLDYFRSFKGDFINDPAASNAMKYFIPQLLEDLKINPPVLYIDIFEYILLNYSGKFIEVDRDSMETIMQYHLNSLLEIGNIEKAVKFALLLPEFDISKKVLEKYY